MVLACRSEEKATKAMKDLQEDLPQAKLTFLQYDQGSFESINRFIEALAKQVGEIDVLINNAGIYPNKDYKTGEGIDATLGK